MKILIDKDVVGKLSNDGDIVPNDIWLRRLVNKTKRQRLRTAWRNIPA